MAALRAFIANLGVTGNPDHTHAEHCTWRSGGWIALGKCNCKPRLLQHPRYQTDPECPDCGGIDCQTNH